MLFKITNNSLGIQICECLLVKNDCPSESLFVLWVYWTLQLCWKRKIENTPSVYMGKQFIIQRLAVMLRIKAQEVSYIILMMSSDCDTLMHLSPFWGCIGFMDLICMFWTGAFLFPYTRVKIPNWPFFKTTMQMLLLLSIHVSTMLQFDNLYWILMHILW